MNQEEQGKKTSPVISDAAVKDDLVIPAKPTDLSDEDLDKVAGGLLIDVTGAGVLIDITGAGIKAGIPKKGA